MSPQQVHRRRASEVGDEIEAAGRRPPVGAPNGLITPWLMTAILSPSDIASVWLWRAACRRWSSAFNSGCVYLAASAAHHVTNFLIQRAKRSFIMNAMGRDDVCVRSSCSDEGCVVGRHREGWTLSD